MIGSTTMRRKRQVIDAVKSCLVEIGDMTTIISFNLLPLGSYDVLIGMGCLVAHKTKVDFYNK